jgi:ATP-binding cassette subfamily B protein
MVRRFIEYYKPHWKLFVLDMATAILRSAFAILIPYFVRILLKVYLPEGDMNSVGIYMAIIFGLAVGMGLTLYINTKWGHVLGARMETDMRSDIFSHLQKLSFKYFDNTKTGHIMSRISNDLMTVSEVAHHAPEDLFIALCMVIGAVSFMFSFDIKLTLASLIPLPLMIFWGLYYGRKMKKGFRLVRKRIADINSNVENSIQGIREVKSYAKEELEIEKFGEVNTEFRRAKEHMYGMMAGFHSGMMFLTESYSLIVIGVGAWLIHRGEISLADVVAFLLYIPFIMRPIHRLVNFVEQFQQGAASFERFIEIMDVEQDIQDKKDAYALDNVNGDIKLENISFKYTDEADWALKNLNMNIQAGKTIALVGESGAGKSTLASLIPRFYEAQEGKITIDGHDIMDLKQKFLRENVGLVQQNVFLFDSTLRENIVFGRHDASEEELIEAAKNANIYDFIKELPEGFDTLVGEHGVKLSGGQKQRVSIARAFLKNPSILIFDEATSSLDTYSETLIQESMEKLCKGRTTIIIAHRLSTVKNADYTYVLQKSELIEQGTHEELLKQKGQYFDLYERHQF